MKRILTLVALSLVFIGVATAENSDRALCQDSSCTVAEAQGLYTDLESLSSSINELRSNLDRCESSGDYCESMIERNEEKSVLIDEIRSSASNGEFDRTAVSLESLRNSLEEGIHRSEREIEAGEAGEQTAREMLELQRAALNDVDSSLSKSQTASLVSIAVQCRDNRCGDEVRNAAQKMAELKTDREISQPSQPLPVREESDRVEQRVLEDGTVYCWGRSCEAPSEAELNDGSIYCWGQRCETLSEAQITSEGSIYCWGRSCEASMDNHFGDVDLTYCVGEHCRLPSNLMESNVEIPVYCWGRSCEVPSTEIESDGEIYCWGRSCPVAEQEETGSETDSRNPQTGKEIQAPVTEEPVDEAETENDPKTEQPETESTPPFEIDTEEKTPERGVRETMNRGLERASSAINNLFKR